MEEFVEYENVKDRKTLNQKKTKQDNVIGVASTGTVDWSVFLQEGVIVTLTIKRYRGTTTVDFAELGIDDTSDATFKSFLSEYIIPGTKRLIPPEIEGQLKSIETSARNNLRERGFDCSAFASNGRFVPKKMYEEFKQIDTDLKERFYDIRDGFADNYDAIVEHVRKDYKVLAENIYMQSHPDAAVPSARYVKTFVDKIIQQIPSADEIVASFEYSTILHRIPENLLNVISKKQNIDERVMRIAASNQDISSTATVRKQESEKAETKKIEAPAKKEPENIDEIEKDIRKSMQEQSAGMANDFLTDILIRVRNDASEGAEAIIKSIEKNEGKLVGRASIKAHSLVDDLKKMNFYGDLELDEHINKLQASLGDNKNNRDVEEVRKAAIELKQWADNDISNIHASTIDRKASAVHKQRTNKTTSPTNTKTTTNKQAATTKTSAKKSTTPSTPLSSREKPKLAVPKTTKRRTIKQRS